jgi:hypothetical protein
MNSGLRIHDDRLLAPAFKDVWHSVCTIEMRLKEPLKHIYWLTESLYRAHVANQDKYYWKVRSEVQEMLDRLDRQRRYQEQVRQPYLTKQLR